MSLNYFMNMQKLKRSADVFKKVTLKDILTTELVGQKLAIDQVASMVSRLETKWINDKHPMVLMFVGATGLGKTEMAKHLARYLRPCDKNSFIHINLSEYQTKHEAAKFTGAPPGYVGYGSSSDGQLIGHLKKNPRAIVLFDEADKAHPDVLATLLQLFDEGRLTSGTGETVECREAIFIMTANLAIKQIKEFGTEYRKKYPSAASDTADVSAVSTDKEVEEEMSADQFVHEFKTQLLHGPLKAAFKRDELLGRVNDLAIFIPFSSAEKQEVISQQLQGVRRLAARSHGLSLSWDQQVLELLSEAFNDSYGARNMIYEIDRRVVCKLSMAQQYEMCRPGDFLHLQVDDLTDGKETRKHIRLYKLSPLGVKTNLDSRFADMSEVFGVKTT